MSNRERWTVYPLLFLTLGIALKDKITKRTDTDTVVCKNLFVTDRQLVRLIVSSSPAGGIVEARGRQANVRLGHADKRSGWWLTDANGIPFAIGLSVPVAALGQPPAAEAPHVTPAETPTQPQQELKPEKTE